MWTGVPQKVAQAHVLEKTDSAASCPALSEGRKEINSRAGTTFYRLDTQGASSSDTGIGIVASQTTPAVVDGFAKADLDHDGHDEVFSTCASSEGIKFAVWTDKAYQGQPRWSGYYYVDYDLTPNCP